MKAIIISIVFAILGVSGVVMAVKKGAEVVEINRDFTKYKKEKAAEIDKLNKENSEKLAKMQADHDRDNEIQYGLAEILSQLSKMGININGKLNEIKKRPVYNIVCSDNDGLQQINKYAGKTPAQIPSN